MKQIEMAKFISWLCGMFPQWKPDSGVAAMWAEELPDITADVAAGLVRRMRANNPSPFPPTCFEILAEARPPKLSGHEAWWRVLHEKWKLTPTELQAVKLIGGFEAIGNSEVDDPFFEKKFIEIFNEVQAREDRGHDLQLEQPREPLKLTGGESS